MHSLPFYAVLPTLTAAALSCRLEGPVLPKVPLSSLAFSPLLEAAAANLTATLDAALEGTITAGWETANSSFSIGLVSVHQAEGAGIPLWEYHHLGEANTNGTRDINRDSQYLIGSISKAISDYIMLRSGVNIDAPVTDFLPVLGKEGSQIQWQDVSLRMLASHLAGAPTNYGYSEYYFLKEVFLAHGLPPISDSDYPPCGVSALNGPCGPQDILNGMRTQHPVTAPNDRPAYSNIAFTIIFLAIEASTGKNYTQLVDELFAQPLGLSNTMPSPGNNDRAVIPPGESSWGGNYGLSAPGGGLVSSLSDLTKFTHHILARTLPMSPSTSSSAASQILRWLKPSTFAGGPSNAVGMPWEIHRSSSLTPAHPHPVTLISKDGAAMSYRSSMMLADEYGLGIVALTAGSMNLLPLLTAALVNTFLPAVDAATRVHAEAQYARTFTSSHGKNVSISASFILDDDSMVISSLERDGKDVLQGMLNIFNATMGQFSSPMTAPFRLYPSVEMDHEVTLPGCNGSIVIAEKWSVSPTLTDPTPESDLPGAGFWQDFCLGWTLVDWIHYGSEPLDRLIFYKNKEGEVLGFEAPFLRSGVLRPVVE